jgi:hypothetical protein
MWPRTGLLFCLASTLSLTLHAGAAKADCLDYSVFPTVTAVERDWTGTTRVRLFGDDYLLALADQDLRVFSLADPSSPRYIAQVDCDAELADFAVCAAMVYCRDWSGAVHVVTLADPTHPVLLGAAGLEGEVTSLGGKDELLAVTAPDSTWSLYQIDDATSPHLLFRDHCDFTVSHVVVEDDVTVVYGGGWRAYDIRVPARPHQIGEQWYGSFHSEFCDGGGTEVLACAVRGEDLVVYLNEWESFQFWHDNWLYGCGGKNRLFLAVIDLFSGNPYPTGSVSLGRNDWSEVVPGSGMSDYGGASLVLRDHYAYALQGDAQIFSGERNRIGIFDIDKKLAPVAVIPSGCYHSFAVSGDHVHASGPLPLTTFETPSPPVDNVWPAGPSGFDPYRRYDHDTAGDGWAAYLTRYDTPWSEPSVMVHTFGLVDQYMRHTGSIELGHADDMAAAGDRLLIVRDLDDFLLWIDLADPKHPSGLEFIPIRDVRRIAPGPARLAAMICGDPGDRGLKIYDLSETTMPVLLGSADIGDPGAISSLLWQGDLLYAISGDSLRIIDVRDPTAPVLAGVLALNAPTWLRSAADMGVLAGNDHEVHLIDATNSAAPYVVASMTSLFGISDVQRVNDAVYVANLAGVWALDLPTLRVIGGLAPQCEVSLLVDQPDALWSTGGSMLQLPLHCGPSMAVGDPTGFPASMGRIVASPNPFNPGATIRFTAPAKGTMELLVFDLSGRVVRTLVDGETAPGPQQVMWDGRGEDGRTVASGTYLVRLRTGKGTETGKLILLK